MGFWDAATRSLPQGMAMGIRASERAEDQKWKEKEFGIREKTAKIAEDKAARDQEVYDRNKIREEGLSVTERARRMANDGDEDGALSTLFGFYPKIPNGDEVTFFRQAANPAHYQQLIAEGAIDPKFANTPILALSKKHGFVPYNSAKEVIFDAEMMLDPKRYDTMMRDIDAKVDDANIEARKPQNLIRSGGKTYVKTFGNQHGRVKEIGTVEYTEPVSETPFEQSLRYAGIKPGSEEAKGVAKTKLGIPAEERAAKASEEALLTSKQGRGLKERKETRDIETHKLTIRKLERDLKGFSALKPTTKLTLVDAATKEFEAEFKGPMGWKDDTPKGTEKDKWISDRVDKRIKMAGDIGAEPTAKGLQGKDPVVREVKGTAKDTIGFIRRIYQSGKEEIIDKTGKVVASRKGGGTAPPKKEEKKPAGRGLHLQSVGYMPKTIKETNPQVVKGKILPQNGGGLHLTTEGTVDNRPKPVRKPMPPTPELEAVGKEIIRMKIPKQLGITEDEAVMEIQEPKGAKRFINRLKDKYGEDPKEWPFLVKKMYFDLAQVHDDLKKAM